MATQRYISTSFWDDAWVGTLTATEKYLYLYLLTNPLTNIAGVYKITTRRIMFDTGLNTAQVDNALAVFTEAKKAVRHGDWIVLPAWPEHQKWDVASKIRRGIEAILMDTPVEILNLMVRIGYRYPIDTLSIPGVYPSNYIDSDSDSDSDSELEKTPLPPKTVQRQKRFVPPTIEEVAAYIQEHRLNVNPATFIDYYISKGWLVGKVKMQDWHAAARGWNTRELDKGKPARPQKPSSEYAG